MDTGTLFCVVALFFVSNVFFTIDRTRVLKKQIDTLTRELEEVKRKMEK